MKYKIKMIYKGAKTIHLPLESEWIDERNIDVLIFDFQKTGRITDIAIMDEMGREWNRKEFAKLQKKLEDEPTNPILYFDGGFDLQSKEAGIGIVIYYQKGENQFRYRANAKLEALESNNEAEYAALYNALLFLQEQSFNNLPIVIRGDSQGVLKQLEGEWPCYEKSLNAWLDKIEEKIKELGLHPNFEVISRKENKEADALATQALQNTIIHSHLKME